jgi:M6 family metalloprotease-like protein
MHCNPLKRSLVIVAIYIVAITLLNAAYVSNMPTTVTQPDGNQLQCLASGDEYHNWLHDANNYTIIRNPNTGYYCYAQKTGEEVTASSVIAGRELPQNRGFSPGINISEAAYKQLRSTKFAAPESRNAPTTGTINNIVIYIRFSDESEFGENISTYTGWFNTSTSSQKNYFLEASYSQLTVNTTFYPAAVNNLVVSWQDSHARAYFQPYDATTNPTGYNGDTERRTREFTLLQNATNGVSSQIPSNLTIDSDGDGRVDNVVFIIKGSAGAWSSLLWPHRWSLYDRFVYINGKRVYDFNLQLQTFLASRAVGVLCHEFFHTLGAPDLYHYTSNGITPAGSWDIMQSDQNPPQHMTAYMKWKYGHWISSIPTISTDQQYTLNPLTSSTGNAYRINSNNSNQYYVVEFRKKTGTFENSLPGSGMLIYRIDTSAGDGNAGGPPDELYIYRPGGTTTADGTISSANYCTETGRTRINSSTNPSPFLQDGSAGNLSLYSIGSSAGATITFNKGIPPIITVDFSTNPYLESFDDALFPPDGWENNAITGSQVFEKVSSGTYPTCSPQAGAAMLRYNSYTASNGNAAYLATPRIDCNNITDYNYSVSFYMYRDTGYTTNADRIEVYLNSSQNLSGTPTLLGTVNRYIGMSPAVATAGWYQYSYILPISTTGYHYVILKAISAYGNNMFLDYLRLSKNTLPPHIAINPLPTPSSAGVSISQVLSWASGGGIVSGYKLYLGTNNPPTNLVNGTNLGSQTSYTYSGGWNYATQYYWKIVPTNSGGDAPSCPVWSFSTLADPRITALPHMESFDAVTAPNLPTGWNSVVSSTSTYAYSRSYSSTTYAVSAPNCVQLTNSSDSAADLRLVSPEVLVPVNSIRFSFSARAGSSGYTLLIGTMDSPTGVFHQYTSLNISSTHTVYSISFGNYSGTDRYIAIKHGLGGTYRSIYLDNLLFDTLQANDLMVNSLQGIGLGTVGVELNYQVSVTNNGTNTQNSYTLRLMAADSRLELASLFVSAPLAAEQTAVHTITWIPTSNQDYSIYAEVVLPGDGYSGNNSSAPAPVTVYSADTYLPIVGAQETGATANTLPLNFYWKNSVSETIYLAEELQMATGEIGSIVLFSNFVESLAAEPVKIWMKNTSLADVSAGWLPFEGYSLVFDGTVDFPMGENNIVINLATAFPYSGGNLAIRFNRPLDSVYFSTYNHFRYFSSSLYPNRSREIHSDTVEYNPALLTETGNLSSNIPLIAFATSNAALAIPQVQCFVSGSNLQLSWNAISGANSYQVYATDNPLVWPDAPLATVSSTSFSTTSSGQKFFKIVASSARQ